MIKPDSGGELLIPTLSTSTNCVVNFLIDTFEGSSNVRCATWGSKARDQEGAIGGSCCKIWANRNDPSDSLM